MKSLWRNVFHAIGKVREAEDRLVEDLNESEKKRREAERREKLLRQELARVRVVWRRLKG